MSIVVVIGHVNHDRVWLLKNPLVSGARLTYSSRDVRLGGGGFHTGGPLLQLGHQVRIVTNLMDDDHGHEALQTLKTRGFDTRHVAVLPGSTIFTEILLDPQGERTILNAQDQLRPPFATMEPVAGDAAYINALALEPGLVSALDALPLVVSQIPLHPATPRPADVLIGSRADLPGAGAGDIWQAGRAVAGPRLRTLILTDGPRPVSLFDGHREVFVAPLRPVASSNTIGAGDRFTAGYIDGILGGASPPDAAAHACHLVEEWLRTRDAPSQE